MVRQDRCAMKVTTDACLFGGWVSREIQNEKWKMENVLDIGTGTGLLSLMLAQKNVSLYIDAIEIDKPAGEQAKENATNSPFSNINILHGDAGNFSFAKKYDAIISNPPFYEKEVVSSNQAKNTAHHFSGLSLEKLLSIIKTNLSADGVFYLLLPFKRNKEIKNILLKQSLFVCEIVFVRQSINHDYFRLMIKGKLNDDDHKETVINEISICDGQQRYTNDFKELLRDYYLNL